MGRRWCHTQMLHRCSTLLMLSPTLVSVVQHKCKIRAYHTGMAADRRVINAEG